MLSPCLLVTTTQAVWVLDTSTGDAWEIESGRGVYYGLTSDGEHIYVLARRSAYGADPRGDWNVVLCFDPALRCVATLCPPFPLRAAHQLIYEAGQLWITDTLDDRIVTHDLTAGTWDRWRPFGEPTTILPNEHHINSIQFCNGSILLAGLNPGGWWARFDRDRHLLGGGKQSLGRHTHNVWQEGGDVWVCSAAEGALLSSAGARRTVHPAAWLRGVSQDGSMAYVGVSQLLSRNRGFSDCSVVAFDAEDAITDCFSFQGYGMVHEIRALNRAEVTHSGEIIPVDVDLIRRTKKRHATARQLVSLTPPPPVA